MPRDMVVSAYRQGLLTSALNPKAPLVFLSVIPQLIPAGAPVLPQTLLLSAVLVGLAATRYLTVAVVVGRLGSLSTRPRVRARLDRVSGVVLVGLGVRLALSPRPA